MRTAFAETVTTLAINDPRVILISGDFAFGAFDKLKLVRPKQYLNVGTCEQSMVGIAAGMAIGGLVPIVYTITPFLIERAFEQIKLDVDQQCLHVILVGFDDYAKDGPTHVPLSPKAMVSLLKNTYYVEPADAVDTADAVKDAVAYAKPTFIRLKNAPPAVKREWPAEGRQA